jgi:hypothetical protein
MSDAERLHEFVKLAYSDRHKLEYLERNHFLHWRKVILQIVDEHFDRLKKDNDESS